jgi:uncharacterized protein (TIGR02246 family)
MINEEHLDRLEERLQRLEDELAVTRLIASYGPLVDAGDADGVAALWAKDGDYDVEGWHMRDRDEVRAMVLSKAHQRFIGEGSVHFVAPAHVTVDGDQALAVCESILVLHRDGEFQIARAGANRIHLRRSVDGWQIVNRRTRTLDGSDEARALLAL